MLHDEPLVQSRGDWSAEWRIESREHGFSHVSVEVNLDGKSRGSDNAGMEENDVVHTMDAKILVM